MNLYKHKIVICLLLVLLASSQCLLAASGTTDREQIINVEKLKASLDEATTPISERINRSQLMQKFESVNNLLEQKEVDKEKLVQALEELRNEMDGFTDNWSEITDPLWKGQEAIGQTIEKVRIMLARTNTGEPSEKVRKSLENYDKRLSNLAKTIKNEKNEERSKRMKMIFANVLALRQLTERAGMIDLGPAQQAVYVKIIEALSNLEVALTNSTFQIEKTRIILEGQAEFVGNYVDILKGLIESEKLAKILGQMNSAGDGIAVLGGDLTELNQKCEAFANNMNALAEKLSDSISAQTSEMMESIDFDETEVNKKIEEYSNKKQ
jgi:hypothetical protein